MPDRRRRRRPVTYAEFNNAVDDLMKENNGEIPTYDQILEKLGGGSLRTIGKFLDRRFPEIPLPAFATESLGRDLAHVALTAFEKPRTGLLKVIGRHEGNKDALLRENGALEDELDQIQSKLEQAQARIQELQAEKQALLQLHQNECAVNEQKLLELAKAAVRAEDCAALRTRQEELLTRAATLQAKLKATEADRNREFQRAENFSAELLQARKDLLKMELQLGKFKGAKQAP